MKRIICLVMAFLLICSFSGCAINQKQEDLKDFYDKVSESQELLDSVADDIYSNWYDAIYDDSFGGDINIAIASAEIDHEDDLEEIKRLDKKIGKLFKELKDDKEYGSLVKEVMSSYSDYYEFVVNVSGSFESYSASHETLKKEFASALKDLSYEI